jgi:hypothetical protein
LRSLFSTSLAHTHIYLAHTPLKKKNKCNAGAKHVGAGKFRHLRRSSGPIYVDDGFFRSMTEFQSPAYCAPASRLAVVTV